MQTKWKQIWIGLFEAFGIVAPSIFSGSPAEERAYPRQPHVIATEVLTFAALVGVSIALCCGFDRLRGAGRGTFISLD
jgi:hypothetical protein